jgi:Spy/CpxP family protein refolding chaperone
MKKITAFIMAGAFLLCFETSCFAQGEPAENGPAQPENNGNSGWWIERGKGMENNGNEIPPAPDTGRIPDESGNRGDMENGPVQKQGPSEPNPER